ncbi:hypothetical protein HYN59_12430 [Flavobacterium album]|uniref:HTH araC/xylS-type domain-containing protein n=1 Tax=Flavobacterium album TaxID=2175091 RepID=A0A2S1QZY0_9FLAO|nr:AraC family transcriptional regulator [Flavobacterium album]AWH85859.1 hypothetical protein HYN59_12430 [Flavobacterium album]
MSSEIYTLPEDFNIGSADTMIYFYTNDRPSVKNKVVFTKNMLCLLQHGEKEVHNAAGKEIITNNEVLLLTAGSTLMTERTPIGKYEAILIFFGNQTLTDFCVKNKVAITEKAPSASIFKFSQDAFLKNFCRSLQLLKEQGNNSMYAFKVQEILGYISTSFPNVFNHFVARALSVNHGVKIKQIVEMNLHKGLTIEELAFLCNMSVSTFKRHFFSLYNMPPQKYFLQQKMVHAKVLLSLGKRPSEIYTELGYENLSAFSNEFKKHFGISPKQFQSENGREAKVFELPEQQLLEDIPATL